MHEIIGPGTSLRIHFIGIGGISMSGLARYFAEQGHQVSGCDRRATRLTQALEEHGIAVSIGHDPGHLDGIDLVIFTAAISRDQPELAEAKARGIPLMERSTLLGEVADCYPTRVAIAGTHGKTTTTGMIGMLATECGLDPTVFIGGELDLFGGNMRLGQSGVFLTEADEYVESFLRLTPTIAVILNIESDHPDFFHDLSHLKRAFNSFVSRVPKAGCVVARTELPNVAEAVADSGVRVISFGQDAAADYHPDEISFDRFGLPEFTAVAYGRPVGRVRLSIPGLHNVQNSLAALAVAAELGVEYGKALAVLGRYLGTKRRFERKGCYSGAEVVDDYAHHPTEVHATLSAARNCPHNRIWCVFQPHTYSRTRTLLDEFAKALSLADRIVISDIYAAREADDGRVHARDLVRKIGELGHEALYLPSFEEIVDYLAKNTHPGDLVLTMGAGDVSKIGEMLIARS